jgi:hypothetical protein
MSVIALGAENEALRRLAAVQRRSGQDVFYHFLSDKSIRDLVEPPANQSIAQDAPEPSGGEVLAAPAPAAEASLAAPSVDGDGASAARVGPPAADEPPWAELTTLVEEWLTMQTQTEIEELENAAYQLQSLREVGLSLERHGTEGERARFECLHREERVLLQRFNRWFPPPSHPTRTDVERSSKLEGEVVTAASCPGEPMSTIETLLATVAEVLELLDGAPLQRRYDAIEVMERLLLEAGIAPWVYASELPRASAPARLGIDRIRQLAEARD